MFVEHQADLQETTLEKAHAIAAGVQAQGGAHGFIFHAAKKPASEQLDSANARAAGAYL
jgi:hypothetical protein